MSLLKQREQQYYYAAKNGNTRECMALIQDGVNVEAQLTNGATLLHTSAAFGRLEVCELFIRNGADVNAREQRLDTTPLHMAAENGHADVCELLINNGAIINATDEFGETPLDISTVHGHTDLCTLLKKHRGMRAQWKSPFPQEKTADLLNNDKNQAKMARSRLSNTLQTRNMLEHNVE